jgi:hypothetical protein
MNTSIPFNFITFIHPRQHSIYIIKDFDLFHFERSEPALKHKHLARKIRRGDSCLYPGAVPGWGFSIGMIMAPSFGKTG